MKGTDDDGQTLGIIGVSGLYPSSDILKTQHFGNIQNTRLWTNPKPQ
jgi:hypothetical protein